MSDEEIWEEEYQDMLRAREGSPTTDEWFGLSDGHDH